jgi:hypothetical protein
MGNAMISVDGTKPDIDIIGGNTRSKAPRAPNPRIFAMIQIKNCFFDMTNLHSMAR